MPEARNRRTGRATMKERAPALRCARGLETKERRPNSTTKSRGRQHARSLRQGAPPYLRASPFHDARRGGCGRVFHLDPIRTPARPVGRIAALRYDAFQPKRARVAEHRRAVAVEMFRQDDPGRRTTKQLRKRVTARVPRLTPHVV